jgi:hypothetical protein
MPATTRTLSPTQPQRAFVIRPLHQACYRALINGGAMTIGDVQRSLTGPLARLDYGTVQSALETLTRRGFARRESTRSNAGTVRRSVSFTARLDRMSDILNVAGTAPREGSAEARARLLDVHALAFDPRRAAAHRHSRTLAQAARRPGSMTFMSWPSRAGSERRWPDGQGGWTDREPAGKGAA